MTKNTPYIRNNLPHIPLRSHPDDEWEKLPHVVLTSDKDWDLTLLYCEGHLENKTWFDAQLYFPVGPNNKKFYELGNYRNRSNMHQKYFFHAESC